MSFLKENPKFPKTDKKIKSISIGVAAVLLLTILVGSGVLYSREGSIQDQLFCMFTEELFCRETAANSISLQYTLKNPENYGIKKTEPTFGTITTNPTEIYASLENLKLSLSHFQKEKLSVKNRLTYEVLEYYIESTEEGAEYILYDEPFGIVSGVQTQLPVVLSEYPFYDAEDVDTYLELLKTTQEYFDELIDFEKQKAEKGLFMSDRAVTKVIEQCEAFVGMGENNYLFSTFVERVNALSDLDMEQRSDYIEKNAFALETCVFPAYQKLIREFHAMKGQGVNEGGLCNFEKGKEYYEQLVQNTVGSERSIVEMKELTKNQIREDLEAMEDILKPLEEEFDTTEIMSQAVYAQETTAMDSANPVTLLNMLEEKITNAFPKPPQTAVDVKYVAKEMEEHLSPAFYMIPAIDNYQENVIYVNQAQMGDTLTLFTTLAHEGYPGHLYQTVYFAEINQDPVRNIFDFGGYVEGWATYAEMCSYYLAPIEKEQAKFLQKYSSVILGIYTLADIGIHYEGWTREDTLSFFSVYGVSDEKAVDRIYDLIIGSPGNYLKYYIGYVEFLELKKQWIQEKGKEFSQVEFHEAVLNVGPAPFEIVEEYMWEM
ncbi:MAG: DUF885 domain-containing protein [Schaedlerella sp.]|nr:DUF885 domain-containing protein [Schaedlerella sp.]